MAFITVVCSVASRRCQQFGRIEDTLGSYHLPDSLALSNAHISLVQFSSAAPQLAVASFCTQIDELHFCSAVWTI
jgi:hypothetical protein